MRPFDPRLLRAVPAARRPVALLAAVGVAQGAATIALTFALAHLVVTVVDVARGGSPAALPSAAAWLTLLYVVRAGLAWVAERVQAWAGVVVPAALRSRLLAQWLTRPAERRLDPDQASTLAAQGVATVEPYVARFLPSLVAGVVVPALAIATLLFVDWVSALVVVLTVPLLPFFAALIGAATKDETERRWSALTGLAGHFLDVVRGLPTLVSYGRAEHQVSVIAEVSRRHRVATMRTLRLAFLSSAALELLATISVAIVAVSVGLRLTHGSMALFPGMLAILLAPEAYWPIRRVGAEFHAAADGAAAVAAALDELDDRHDRDDEAAAGPTEDLGVTVRGLSYRYPGVDREVVTGLDVDAGPGLTVLTGTSGVGKSTLLEIIAGLRTPAAGTVRSGAAHLVTQRPFLPSGTLRAALTLGNGAADDAAWEALRAVGLDGFVAALPEALASPIGDDGFGLSAGQRARVALARALLSRTPVLLLDEPTAHLDAATSELVHEAIARAAERRTVLVVTHRSELVGLADQHLHLTSTGVEVRSL